MGQHLEDVTRGNVSIFCLYHVHGSCIHTKYTAGVGTEPRQPEPQPHSGSQQLFTNPSFSNRMSYGIPPYIILLTNTKIIHVQN